MKQPPLVLIVDDDPAISTLLARALTRSGFRAESTASPDEALARAAKGGYDAALLDVVMPEKDGVALATALRELIPGLPIGLLTGYRNSPLVATAERVGAAVFAKPVVIHEIVDYLKERLARP